MAWYKIESTKWCKQSSRTFVQMFSKYSSQKIKGNRFDCHKFSQQISTKEKKQTGNFLLHIFRAGRKAFSSYWPDGLLSFPNGNVYLYSTNVAWQRSKQLIVHINWIINDAQTILCHAHSVASAMQFFCSRFVSFFRRGLPNEKKSLQTQIENHLRHQLFSHCFLCVCIFVLLAR